MNNKKQQIQIKTSQLSLPQQNDQKFVVVTSMIIGLNIMLMYYVSIYWLNPQFHIYISGKPL